MFNLSLLTALLLCSTAFSATNTTKSSISKPEEKPPISLEMLLATELTKNSVEKNFDGTYTKFDTSLLHHYTKNDELRYFLSTRFITNDDPAETNKLEAFFFEWMYRRKNILNQSKHGVNLETEMKLLQLLDKNIQNRYGYNRSFIPQLVFRKSFNRKTSAKLRLRKYFFNNTNEDPYTLDTENRAYLDITRFINRKYMINAQLKYQHKIRKATGPDFRFMSLAKFNRQTRKLDTSTVPTAHKNQEIVTLHAGILKFLEGKNMLELYVETQLSDTYDSRSVADIAEDQLVFGAALYITAF